MTTLQEVQKLCLKRGIIFPTAEIYQGLSGFFDYGPIGASIKRRLENYWRSFFLKPLNILEMGGSTILPEEVFRASGHLESFIDPITQCKKCNAIYRADELIEQKTGKNVEGKTAEELTKLI
ncbi:glycine--tRNA ligase, partial [bacterium]|nr:glycine--tRNA ligase [bacterium]